LPCASVVPASIRTSVTTSGWRCSGCDSFGPSPSADFGFGLVGSAVGLSPGGVLGMGLVGAVAAVGRTRGRVERALEERTTRMRIEIYTIDQLLALRVRAGGAVMQAVMQVVERGRGEVVAELAEAIRLHRAGLSVAEAFRRVADLSPEPACARTYRLLGIADERGVDLAAGLLALAEDVRETRREAMKRAATRRRAAMLVPTIALLAPTLLLFVAAPLPYLLTGWR
jgi:tight adherence protein C